MIWFDHRVILKNTFQGGTCAQSSSEVLLEHTHFCTLENTISRVPLADGREDGDCWLFLAFPQTKSQESFVFCKKDKLHPLD